MWISFLIGPGHEEVVFKFYFYWHCVGRGRSFENRFSNFRPKQSNEWIGDPRASIFELFIAFLTWSNQTGFTWPLSQSVLSSPNTSGVGGGGVRTNYWKNDLSRIVFLENKWFPCITFKPIEVELPEYSKNHYLKQVLCYKIVSRISKKNLN